MPRLYGIKATDAVCVYVEVGFRDNPDDGATRAELAAVVARLHKAMESA